MTPLLPWRPASLSPSLILRFCATYTRTSSLTPGDRSSPLSRLNFCTEMTRPVSPCGTLRQVSRTSRAFSPKMARSRRSSGVSSVSPFGVTLPTSTSPGEHLGADADDAVLVEVGEHVLADVRDVAGDLLRAELGVAGLDLVLLDVDRGEDVLLDDALGEDDRVLVVVALPRHERDEEVLCRARARPLRRRTVGEHVVDRDLLPDRDDRAVVDAGALVGAHELRQVVLVERAVLAANDDQPAVDVLDGAGTAGADDLAGVDDRAVLHAGAHERRLRAQQRHRLALHVRAHQRAVRVVVLQERDERGGDRDHLARRDVHVLDVGRQDLFRVAAHAHAAQDRVALELAGLRVEGLVRLGDDVAVFLVGGQVLDLVRDLAALDLAVRASR